MLPTAARGMSSAGRDRESARQSLRSEGARAASELTAHPLTPSKPAGRMRIVTAAAPSKMISDI